MGALDRPEALAVDSLGLIPGVGEAVQAFDRGRASAEALEIPFPPEAIREVAICGMGGSAIAGDLIAGIYRDRLRRPVTTVRDYILPGWVGEDTLVVLCSYSGNTEETLTCTMQALERKSLIVGITSNGKLADLGGREGMPIITVPPGMQPRAALLDLFTPMLVTLSRLGVIPELGDELDDGRSALDTAIGAYGPGVPEDENPAKQLATVLMGSVPVIYGAEATAALGYRWKCQFNENSKVPSFFHALPEMDHNEIVGYEGQTDFHTLAHVLMLRDVRQHRQVERRFELTKALIQKRVRGVISISGDGETALARLLDLVLLGDYVSLYLACLQEVDPGPVDIIEQLKRDLSTAGYGRIEGEG
jgi:glucose/mannose-6-phosphate isomerase